MSVKKRLVRVGPLQLGKMLGALYGVLGLIFVPLFGVFALIGAFVPKQADAGAPGAVFAGVGLLMMILFPIMYAVMGFVTGLVGAAVYNLLAKWIGGIEVEVE